MAMIETFNPEAHERAPVDRLETYLVFVRHGKAEKIEGAETSESLDAIRQHTTEGETQVYNAGKRFAKELQLQPNDVIFKRSSPRVRAKQTVEGAVQGFLEGEKEQGIETFKIQKSHKPARPEFGFPSKTANAYAVGAGRRGTTQGLCEEWVRFPEKYQEDLAKAGLGENATEELLEMKNSFQNVAALMDRAGKVLLNRWDKTTKNETAIAPRLIVFAGGHGFVAEPWLKEVVSNYEKETGKKVPIELGYGDYFAVHFPSNAAEPVTLRISGDTIPISEELLKRIDHER